MISLKKLYEDLEIKNTYEDWKESVLLCFDEGKDFIIDKNNEIYIRTDAEEELRRLERLAAKNRVLENISSYKGKLLPPKKYNFIESIIKLLSFPKDIRKHVYVEIENIFNVLNK